MYRRLNECEYLGECSRDCDHPLLKLVDNVGITKNQNQSSHMWHRTRLSSFVNRQEGNVLFNDALDIFLIWLYGIGDVVKDHSCSERGNLLPPLHGLLFPNTTVKAQTCTFRASCCSARMSWAQVPTFAARGLLYAPPPQTVMEYWLELEIAQ